MRAFKIVVTGPRGAGKTSFVETISETALVSSEERGNSSGHGDSGATVEMDFGRIAISDDTMIYLFGTQGMERFDFMWKAISEGILGFILMVDGSHPETFEEARSILQYFRSRANVPCVVGVNRVPHENLAEVSTLLRVRLEAGATPLLSCNSSSKEEVKQVLLELLYQVLEDAES